jgi:hypothetical protein
MSGSRKAHRVFYASFNGEIPDGICVCHKCDVRHCVNPDHLFLSTNVGNTADRHAKKRDAIGEKNGASKLTAENVKLIRLSNLSGRKLAKIFGVTHRTIGLIKRREIWASI